MKVAQINFVLLPIVFLISTSSWGWARTELTPAELEKCFNPMYFGEARKYFSCEKGWSLDSCEGLNPLAVGVAGVVAFPLVKGIFEDVEQMRRLKAHEQLTKQFRNQKKQLETKYEQIQNLYRSQGIKVDGSQGRDGLALNSDRAKLLRSKLKEEPLKDFFRTLTVLLAEADELERKYNDLQDPKSNSLDPKSPEKSSGRAGKSGTIRSGLWGAAAGTGLTFAFDSVPFLAREANKKLCGELKGQEQAAEFLRSSYHLDGCRFSLSDSGEHQLLSMASHGREIIFKNNPLLCRTFIKKQEARLSRLASYLPEVTLKTCQKEEMETTIKIRNRAYHFTVQDVGGKLVIKSPLGYSSHSKSRRNASELSWTFDPEKKRLSDPKLSSDSEVGKSLQTNILLQTQLDFLGQRYMDLGDKFSPISLNDKNYLSAIHIDRDVAGTVAEQSIALKLGLGEAVAACAAVTGKAQSSASSQPGVH